jgi:hypothetical protein
MDSVPTNVPPAPDYAVAEGTGFRTDGANRATNKGVRTMRDAADAATCFLGALGIRNGAADFAGEHRKRTLSLMQQTVLAVEWYDDEIAKGEKTYWIYLYGALFVLIGVPILAVIILSATGSPDKSTWAELLVTAAAAIFGAQALLREAFNRRFRFGAFWEARSKIKTAYANLLSKWQGRRDLLVPTAEGLAFCDELTADMKLAREEARVAIEAEKRAFFDQLQLPDVQFGGFSTARTGILKMITDATPAPVAAKATAAQEAAKADQKRLDLMAAIQRIDSLIRETERQQAELNRSIDGEPDARKKEALKADLKPRRDSNAAILTKLYADRQTKTIELANT